MSIVTNTYCRSWGSKAWIFLAVLFPLQAWAEPTAENPPNSDEDYVLVWSDEFETAGKPSNSNWGYEHGFVRNNELQWYQTDNARCLDGFLVIEAKREQVENPHYNPSAEKRQWKANRQYAEYTSSSLNTRGKHAWKYGRFTMRAKIDVQPGMWPAFWTLGTSKHWPACGEIDIMEYYRGEILANVAWLGSNPRVVWDSVRTPISQLGDKDWANNFHEWRMDWEPDEIRLYVDDRLLNKTDISQVRNADETGANPFHQPHYLLVNLAMGGENGGDPTPSNFPSKYLIDYVRVYQKPSHTKASH